MGLILPALSALLLLFMLPMLLLFRISLNTYDPMQLMVEALSWHNYARALADDYYRQVLATTLGVAAGCTVLALLLGFPAACRIARAQGRWKSALVVLTVFPLLTGSVVRSAGWMALIGTDGAINAALRGLGLGTLELLYTPAAVLLGTLAVVLPFMVLTLATVVEAIPRQLEEAAASLGAAPATVGWRVLLPLAMPGIAAGSALVFSLAMNAYATPVLLGGPRFAMLAPAIYDQFVRASNWPLGASLSFLLLATTLGITALSTLALARRRPDTRRS